MGNRRAGKGHVLNNGTRRDGFFRLPHKPDGFDGRKGIDRPQANGDRRENGARNKKLERFLADMHNRAARFDPFPTPCKE